ncbi:MAG: FAD-dependent tricarballylate dehydrogenase TcuA [Luminiphilus sp.]
MSKHPNPDQTRFDVVVVGGGNAGLCAAMTAAEQGARVLILEGAPKPYRGGNSRHTRNFRCQHDAPLGVLTDSYSEGEYYDDLIRVTGGQTDETLARIAIRGTSECFHWMQDHGVHFQPSLSGTLSLSRTNAFFMGGGKSLVNAYYRTAEALGVEVVYEAQVTELKRNGQRIESLTYQHQGRTIQLIPKSVVVASGGFQSNLDWLADAWGPAARNFLVRGTPYNRGTVLKNLLDQDVSSVGDPTQCHAVAIDGRSPQFDGGIVTRLDCVPFSIVVNKNGQRFYNEGEDVWPKRYAIWGRLVAAQPDQIGYAVIDAKSINLFMPSVFPPIKADTLEELAEQLGIPADQLTATVDTFNRACQSDAQQRFHPTELDGVSTQGLEPAKTNWARPIDTPPFYGYSLKTGVTFTYMGLKVDANAQVQTPQGPLENLWAAGETMAGSILGKGYLAGFGMTIGTVFGRIAGQEAARHANH